MSWCVDKVDAKWPPAEKPRTPILFGLISHLSEFALIILIALWASSRATLLLQSFDSQKGTLCFKTKADTPRVFNHFATSTPSLSNHKPQYPPPGITNTAALFLFFEVFKDG